MISVCLDFCPFVLLDLGGADRTEGDIDAMFASLRESHARARKAKTRHVLVGVAPATPDAGERKLIAIAANRVPAADRVLFVSSVLVVPSPIIRGVITAIGWLVPGLPPFESVPSATHAVPAAAAILRRHHIPFREELVPRATAWLTQPATRVRAEPRSAAT
jgi:hypothetical protein